MVDMEVSKFCPKTGELHSQYPPSFIFCPGCRTQLQPITPVRKKDTQQDIIIIADDSPDVQSKAIMIPSQIQKGQSRTAAEAARQQTFHRSGSGLRGLSVTARIPINVIAGIAFFQTVVESTIKIPKFFEWQLLRTYNTCLSSFIIIEL
jgi:hypothetical protein